MSAMQPPAMRKEIKRLRGVIRSQSDDWSRTRRELSEVKSNLAGTKNVLADVLAQRDNLSAQVRNLTAEKKLCESRNTGAGRIIGELRHQRADVLQALARVLADLAATPEAFNNPRPAPAPKDEAPF